MISEVTRGYEDHRFVGGKDLQVVPNNTGDTVSGIEISKACQDRYFLHKRNVGPLSVLKLTQLSKEDRIEVLGWTRRTAEATIQAWNQCIRGKNRVLVIDLSGTRVTDLIIRGNHLPYYVEWVMCEKKAVACSIREKGEEDLRPRLTAMLKKRGHKGRPFNHDILKALELYQSRFRSFDLIHFILDPDELSQILGFRRAIELPIYDEFRPKFSIEVCSYDRPRPAYESARKVAREILGPNFEAVGPMIQMIRRKSPQGSHRWRRFFKYKTP